MNFTATVEGGNLCLHFSDLSNHQGLHAETFIHTSNNNFEQGVVNDGPKHLREDPPGVCIPAPSFLNSSDCVNTVLTLSNDTAADPCPIPDNISEF